MKTKKIILPDNHNRATAASVYIIEKLVDELECEMLHYHDKIMKKTDSKSTPPDKAYYSELFKEIRAALRRMAEKYDLPPSHFNLSQIINSRKSKMWEVISNTKSKQLKGFGKFPPEYAGEFDTDLDELLQLIERI